MLARLGLQELHVRIARSKRMPCFARRSIFGVRMARLPYGPQSSHPMSSAIRRTKFGRSLCAARRDGATAQKKKTQTGHHPIRETITRYFATINNLSKGERENNGFRRCYGFWPNCVCNDSRSSLIMAAWRESPARFCHSPGSESWSYSSVPLVPPFHSV